MLPRSIELRNVLVDLLATFSKYVRKIDGGMKTKEVWHRVVQAQRIETGRVRGNILLPSNISKDSCLMRTPSMLA